MFHHTDVIINEKTGVPIPGAIVRVYTAGGVEVDLFADDAGTPIETVSGLDNAAVTDNTGTFSYYVEDGRYTLQFYIGDALLRVTENIWLSGPGNFDASTDLFRREEVFLTAGQTLVTLTQEYIPGLAVVYRNAGILLTSEYTAPGGFSLTLATPGLEGESVIVSYVVAAERPFEHYIPQLFGAVGDGVTDDAPAFQAALDFLVSSKNGGTLFVPSATANYYWASPVVYRATQPIRILGEGPSGTPYSNEGRTTIKYGGPAGSTALLIETSGANEGFPLNGAEVENILIYRDAIESASTPGKGIVLKGVTRGVVRNSVTWGFATGIQIDDNPLSSGGTSIRSGHILLDNVATYLSAISRCDIGGAAEIKISFCNFQQSMVDNYLHGIYIHAGTNGGRTDNVAIEDTMVIGGTDNVTAFPSYGVLIEEALWINCQRLNIERAVTGIKCTYTGAQLAGSTASGDLPAISMDNCLFDAIQGRCVDFTGVRYNITNTRTHQLPPGWNGWVGTVTEPAIRIRGGSGTQIPALGGVIVGPGPITFEGSTGVDIDNCAGVHHVGLHCIDMVRGRDNLQPAKPAGIFGTYTSSCSVMMQGGSGLEAPWQDNGGFNTVISPYYGFRHNNEPSYSERYVEGVMDGSGNASVVHGETDFTQKGIDVIATWKAADGTRVAATVNFYNNTAISISGGAPAASAPYRVTYRLRRDALYATQ